MMPEIHSFSQSSFLIEANKSSAPAIKKTRIDPIPQREANWPTLYSCSDVGAAGIRIYLDIKPTTPTKAGPITAENLPIMLNNPKYSAD